MHDGSAVSSNNFTQSMEIETSRMPASRTNSRPKPPRPSKLKNTNIIAKAVGPEFHDNGIVDTASDHTFVGTVAAVKPEKTDEQLLDFLNSPSQNLDEGSLLRSEIASQSREMNLLLRNHKKLQQGN
jgi:hypothetical protein